MRRTTATLKKHRVHHPGLNPHGHTHHKPPPKPKPNILARLEAPPGLQIITQKISEKNEQQPLTAFSGADSNYELRFGDHLCVMGANGSGKSLFWQALSGRKTLSDTDTHTHHPSNKNHDPHTHTYTPFTFMSFSMHTHFLAQNKNRVVADVLGGSSDPLARRLIVQLGLYPMWYKKVYMLSTGEIRKVLLASVLSKSPKILVLDKPYDGLDGPSRKSLKGVLSQLCQGFPRLLVELGLARRNIERTSMILITHREEEIPEEVTRLVAVKDLEIDFQGPMDKHKDEVKRRLTHTFPHNVPIIKLPRLFRPQVPRAETLSNERTKENLSTLLEFSNVHLQKGEHTLLHSINWKVKQGDFWALKGTNGAGKSTLTRLILEALHTQQHHRKQQWLAAQGTSTHTHTPTHTPTHKKDPLSSVVQDKHTYTHTHIHTPSYQGHVAVGVPHLGIVSTEVHLALAAKCGAWPTSEVILSGLPGYHFIPHHHQEGERGMGGEGEEKGKGGGGAGHSGSKINTQTHTHTQQQHLLPLLHEISTLLHLPSSLLSHPFHTLSQGQQKLCIIARALISAPSLLIFDEACQGLDAENRTLVLSVLKTIARAAGGWVGVVYVSHHEDEGMEGVVSHVLDLEKGQVNYCGGVEGWRKEGEKEGSAWGLGCKI